jgi:acetate---CoA ligase (ADP-forming)
VSSSRTTPVDVAKLFAPRSIAIVGASEDRHYSRSIIANLRQHGFPDDAILPINPRYTSVSGLTCYPDLTTLPHVPDAVALLVGKKQATGLLQTAASVGVGAALVIADGYAEESAEGLAEQHRLGDIAQVAGMAVLGPNTLGYVVPATSTGMWCAGALPAPLTSGGVAILAQSSGMLNLIMGLAGQRLLGIRACVSVGNAEVLGLPELVNHFVADPECSVLGLVVESIDRPKALMQALSAARAAGKPVIVLKIGVSDLGRQNSVAHTGRMAGPEQGWAALFDRLDVVAARDLDDFIETLTLFGGVIGRLPDAVGADGSLGIALATISGGETSLICDIAAQEGLPLATLCPDSLAALRAGLGKESMIGNPLDLQNTRTSRPEVFWSGIETVCADPQVDVFAVRFNLSERPTPALKELYTRVAEIARSAGKAHIVLTRAYEHLDLAWWRFFANLGVPFVLSYRNSLRAFASLQRWRAGQASAAEDPGAVPEFAATSATTSTALDSKDTVAWLASAGVPYVRSVTVRTSQDAAYAAEKIGWPVVLKAVAPGLVHKSEAGGVALDLSDSAEVEAAAKAMAVSVADAVGIAPESVDFEVQEMVSAGVEMIVGVTPDSTWGPVMLIGAGGIHAETTGDVVWDLPPVSQARARDLLQRLRIWPVLDGARNKPPADVDALVDLIVAFGKAVAAEGPALAAVDLNPVVVAPVGSGVRAVDAAIMRPDATVARPLIARSGTAASNRQPVPTRQPTENQGETI